MKAWMEKIINPNFAEEDQNRRAFNLNVILVASLGMILLGLIAVLIASIGRSRLFLITNALSMVAAALLLIATYLLSKKGYPRLASSLFIFATTTAACSAVLTAGLHSFASILLLIPIVTTGATISAVAGLELSIFTGLFLIFAWALEALGVTPIAPAAFLAGAFLNLLAMVSAFLFAVLGIWLSGYRLRLDLSRVQQAFAESKARQVELEKELQVEREGRSRLMQSMHEFGQFLERIHQGDYQARVSFSRKDEELSAMEGQINATMETLIQSIIQSESALQQADLAQRRYVVQSWQDYARGRISSDFEIARQEAAPLRAQLLPAIEQAASQRRTLTLVPDEVSPGYSEEKSPAIVAPIQLRGEVIGTLALARKPDGYTWSEDEQAMVEAIAERLALAADNMRLLEETQRRAAREQLIGEITGHMRQTLDVETVLKTAVDEIYRVLELKEMTAWLAPNLAQATEAAPSHSSGNGHDAHPNGRKSARLDRADDPSKGE